MKDNEQFELVKADEKDCEYSNPLLRILSAVFGIVGFGSLIAIFMAVLSAFAGGASALSVKFFCSAGMAFALSAAAAAIAGYYDKKERRKFLKHKKALRKNAVKIEGRIVGIEKRIRHVSYMNDVFDEILWNFQVEYKNENNETLVVPSDRFLNDISEVLKNDKVTVYVMKDGKIGFGGYQLRKSAEDRPLKLKINVIETNSGV